MFCERLQSHYGMLDQNVGTTSWTNMLYQLVEPTFHTNFRVGVNSLVKHVGIICLSNLWYQHVGPTFHSEFVPLDMYELSNQESDNPADKKIIFDTPHFWVY